MSSLELGCMNVMAEADAQGVKRELLLVGIVPQSLMRIMERIRKRVGNGHGW